MADEPGAQTHDVLPPVVNQLLGLAWIALFAGRWIVVQLLLAGNVLAPSMVADLDDRVLMRIYLVLLAVTVLVSVLRAMRNGRSGSASDRGMPSGNAANPSDSPNSGSLHMADRRPNSGD